MVHDDNHSTLRARADSISRRAGSIGMAGSLKFIGQKISKTTPCKVERARLAAPAPGNHIAVRAAKNLKFKRHTFKNWDKLPIQAIDDRVHPNARTGRHRPQNPRSAAI